LTSPTRSTAECRAGSCKDPITAQGISDAFRDAELCATALDETFCGASTFEDAMSAYQRTRDVAMDAFVSITACTVSPVESFDPEHIGRVMGAVGTR
jgi:2-polyprenyl-6-methoxyphenol hydroxylase-like FAD-dependent oxidoreductase